MQRSVEEPLSPDEQPARNPWLLVVVVSAGLIGIMVLGIVVSAWLAPVSSEALRPNECRLQDGSVLTIEKVTWGKLHEHSIFRWSSPWPFLRERRNAGMKHFTAEEGLGISMTRRDARSGQPLNFNWWSGNATEDVFGNVVRERGALFSEAGHGYSKGGQMRRPFVAHMRADTWLVYSFLPMFHTSGNKFTLKVKNNSNEVVGTIELNHPSPTPDLGWQVEPVPATKTDGEVTVTFKGFSALADKSRSANPSLDARWGQRSADRMFLGFSDQLGREWPSRRRSLDDSIYHERVWKARVSVHKWPNDMFDANETWTFKPISIPAVNVGEALSESRTVNGCKVTLEGIGGSGDVSYAVNGDSVRHRGPAGFVKDGPIFSQDQSYHAELKTNAGAGRVKVTAPCPHLLLRIEGRHSKQIVFVKMFDDQTREVFCVPIDDYGLFMLKPEPDARSISPTVIIHTGREFEFFVKPPDKPLFVR